MYSAEGTTKPNQETGIVGNVHYEAAGTNQGRGADAGRISDER